MRVAVLTLAGFALAAPVLAQPVDVLRAPNADCAASLQSTQGGAGYQLVRTCGKGVAGKGFALPRGMADGEAAVGEDGVSPAVISLFAIGAIAGVVVLASDGAPTSP